MKQGTVFIVDDDAAIRRALERLIRSVGLEVETFASAKEFLDRDPPEGPACIVTDVRMPGLSGLDLQKELSSSGLDLPVILITGHGTVPMSVRAMKAGAVDFLQKPVDDQVLLDTIHQAIEQDQRTRKERDQRNILDRRLDSLTSREREVFALVVQGLLNKQVAAELGTSEKTIKVHRGRVMQKMEAESLADLVRMGELLGIRGSTDTD
jgi:RNA polymerase sigma factor (sigma-70 family)